MSPEQIVTLIVAVYGALVSTVLAIRELRKDKRRILIILEYVVLVEQAHLTITNVGHRSTTITGIEMWSYSDQGGRSVPERVPRNALFASDAPLPTTLNDGEHVTIRLFRCV